MLIAAGLLAVAGCGEERGDGPGGGTTITASGGSTGDPDPSGTDADPSAGSTGADTDPTDTGGSTGDPTGASSTGGDPSGGSTSGGGFDEAPDCSLYWMGQYIPNTMYMSMEPPESAEEMFCYVNMERINYQFHGRNNGCVWDGDGNAQLSWPYEMEFDATLTAAAQAAADDIAAGGQPPGMLIDGGFTNPPLYVDGCASDEYTVSATNDALADWPNDAALSNSNGTARMGVFYYDPGPASPTLTKMGVGMSTTGNLRNWVVKLGP